MDTGKLRRLGRIFGGDERTVIVAMDHGAFYGLQAGLEKPGPLIEQVVAGGADAVMTTIGIATRFASALAPTGLILRADGGVTEVGAKGWRGRLITDAESALKLGADAVVAMGFPGAEREEENLVYLAELSQQCTVWGLPLMGEMLPRGLEGGEVARLAERMAAAARVGAELGVDVVKTQYTGSVEGFRKTVANCFVPVVVLGGPKGDSDGATLQLAREAMDAGARGVAMGRNIWGHKQPLRMTQALAAIVHGDASVAEALEVLQGGV